MTNLKSTYLALIMVLLSPMVANAEFINITTDVDVISQPSFTFGDYIFELVDPTKQAFNLVTRVEDFIVSNICCGMDFTLRRQDNAAFSLLGLRHAGEGIGTIGGVAVQHVGAQVFENFAFAGQVGVTNVNLILFSPSNFTQISAFEVDAAAVPEPGTLALLGIGLAGMGLARRRKNA